MSAEDGGYGVGQRSAGGELVLPALNLSYPQPTSPAPRIGLIGCGGISEHHLAAYQRLGFDVIALCNREWSKAEERAAQYYPGAAVYSSHVELLEMSEVDVVDIATHPDGRSQLIHDSLDAGKHVLSQKPLCLNLDEVEPLIRLADEAGRCFAVNQNGRWAPHLAAMRFLSESGVIGQLEEIEVSIRWDHSWTIGTPFDHTPFLVLFDFGIHWFDFISTLLGDQVLDRVEARVARSPGQRSPQPMLAEVGMSGPGLRVRMTLDGDSAHLQRDVTLLRGSAGVITSEGPDLQSQRVRVHAGGGSQEVPLHGGWFTTGFEGAMAELLCAVQAGRRPSHSAGGVLRSLELGFAACESANTGVPVNPGTVRALPAPAMK